MDKGGDGTKKILIARRKKNDIKHILSVESQKGVIADQRCSLENQKGAIATEFYSNSALLVLKQSMFELQ